MTALVDLHLHTTASDGRLTPQELVRLVAQRGLRYIAITDHDSMEGLPAAQEETKEHPELTLISGVELGTDLPQGEVHILGYFLDPNDQEFQEQLKEFRDGRTLRARHMVERLAELGMPVRWERVEELSQGGAIARPHIALAMMEAQYIQSFQEAFDKYIGRDGPAYTERAKMTPSEAVALILRHRGVPVLAHPARYIQNLEEVLPSLCAAGLAGIEVHYKDYTSKEVEGLERLCQEHGLVPCGGSDYHALKTPDEVEPGIVGPPLESFQRLSELALNQGSPMAVPSEMRG